MERPLHLPYSSKIVRLSADSEGNMSQEPLTALTHNTPYEGLQMRVLMAVGDGRNEIVTLSLVRLDSSKRLMILL